jgi:uncharacterized repeat protein (TIGR02543 family)
MPAANVVLTALWEELLYTVTYLPGGTNVGGLPANLVNVSAGTTVTVGNAPTRNGYLFRGWASSQGGTLQPGDAFIMPAADLTLTAIWETTPPVDLPEEPEPESPGGPPESPTDIEGGTVIVPGAVPGSPIITILGTPIPLFGIQGASWSLFDLICTLIALIAALVMIVRVVIHQRRKKEEKEELNEDGTPKRIKTREEEQEEQKEQRYTKIRIPLAVISALCAILSVILFILTQDMRLPMVFFDFWSIFFAVFVILGIITTILTFKRETLEKEEENDEYPQYRRF